MTDSITVETPGGAEIELTSAGIGSRCLAFIIDWHLRVFCAAAWLAVGIFFNIGDWWAASWTGGPQSFSTGAWLPPLLIYFLYHPILEIGMQGRTPGKRVAGLRVLTRAGEIPDAGALLMRNLLRAIDSLPVLYLAGLLAVVFTRHHARIGDLAAGTLLVVDPDARVAAAAGEATGDSTLQPTAAELIHELLERWPALQEQSRVSIARSLLMRLEPRLPAAQVERLDSAQLYQQLIGKLGR